MERYMMILKSYKRMPLEMEQALVEIVRPMHVLKGDIIQAVGAVTDNLFFVEKGLFRIFDKQRGKKETLRFKKEDEFIWILPGSLISLLKEQYAHFNIQYSVILNKEWISMDTGMKCSNREGGLSNYERLRVMAPELIDRVPLPYLADFIHIPEKKLCRLQANKLVLHLTRAGRKRQSRP